MCITSPPYWGLRNYGIEPQIWDDGGVGTCTYAGVEHDWTIEKTQVVAHGGHWQQASNGPELQHGRPQTRFKGDVKEAGKKTYKEIETGFCRGCHAWRGSLGLEPTIDLYVSHIVQVFREVRRVLRRDGTCWLNLGDSYAVSRSYQVSDNMNPNVAPTRHLARATPGDLKQKDLCMIPARVALALQADGWYLRQDIIWAKGISFCDAYSGSAMPESVRDRLCSSHEHIFLLTKASHYYFDLEAIKENGSSESTARYERGRSTQHKWASGGPGNQTIAKTMLRMKGKTTRTPRSVWAINTQAFSDAHFATFPEKIPEICVKAGTSEKGCCPECGAPWVRITERVIEGGYVGRTFRSRYKTGTPWNKNGQGATTLRKGGLSFTVGWRPACDCGYWHQSANSRSHAWQWFSHEPTPCTVLDPFSGSGTSAVVAEKLGRKWILLELSPAYCEMAANRITRARDPGAYKQQVSEQATGQQNLFI